MPDVGQYWLQRDQEISLELITFDFSGTEGQARALDTAHGTVRLQELELNPPDEMIVTKLWEKRAGVCRCPPFMRRLMGHGPACGRLSIHDARSCAHMFRVRYTRCHVSLPLLSGGPYVALSHQHTLWALQKMRQKYIDANAAVPEWCNTVKAHVLAHGTPVEVRQLVSGGDQNREAAVVAVAVSRVVEMFLSLQQHSPGGTPADVMQKAIQLTGARRPLMAKQLASVWNGIMYWANHCPDLAVRALVTLEKSGLASTPGSLRNFRKLLTPRWRRALAENILAGVRNQADLEKLIGNLRHQQLVEFHWRTGNPNIEDDKGVRCSGVRAHVRAMVEARVCVPWSRV
jgi:hypothetical protein